MLNIERNRIPDSEKPRDFQKIPALLTSIISGCLYAVFGNFFKTFSVIIVKPLGLNFFTKSLMSLTPLSCFKIFGSICKTRDL